MRQMILAGYRLRLEPEYKDVSTLADTFDGFEQQPEQLFLDIIVPAEKDAIQKIQEYFQKT